MALPSETQAFRAIRKLFAEWLGVSEADLDARQEVHFRRRVADFVLRLRGVTFVMEYKGPSEAAVVARAIEQAKAYAKQAGRSAVPVVAVAYMGDVGRELCE